MRIPPLDRPMKVSALVVTALLSSLCASFAHAAWVDATTGALSMNSNGVAFGDIDNDGDLDLAGFRVFRNEGGGVFIDAIGVPLAGFARVFGDIDNDGDLDLFHLSTGDNRLFRNEGGGTFVDVTSGPLGNTGSSLGAAFGDVDNDGDLDLYVSRRDQANKLLRNEGGGVFVDATSGPLGDTGDGMGVAFGDIDTDGDLDLYVANVDGGKLLRNEGSGVFVDATSGPLGATDGRGVVFGDLDNDGDLDLYLTRTFGSRLLRNEGGATFVDVTIGPLGGPLGAGTGVAFGDVDNDGDLDLYVASVRDGQVRPGLNKMLRNDGGGMFVDVTTPLLLNSGTFGSSTGGVAFGDVDNDGDLDLYLANGGTSKLFRNDGVASGNRWLHINLVGTASNRSAIGARVRVVAGGVSQIREVSGGSGYWSQNSLTAEFGLGSATGIDSIEIHWPSGIVQVLTSDPGAPHASSLTVDQVITITEDSATPALVSTIRADAEPGLALVSWHVAGVAAGNVSVYRRELEMSWQLIATIKPDPSGRVFFEDRDVLPGQRYGYRIGIMLSGHQSFFEEVWLNIPLPYQLVIRSVRQQPEGMAVSFDLPQAGETSLALVDISGRRVAKRRLGRLEAGSHDVALKAAGLPAGVYFATLTQGEATVARKAVVVR